MYRMLFASILLIPIVYRYRFEFTRLSSREWLSLIIAGLFLALHFGFWFESLQLTSVASSTVILALQPIVAMIAAYLIDNERITRAVVISVFISFTRVIISCLGCCSFSNLCAFSGKLLSFLSVVAVVCYFMIVLGSVRNLKHWVFSFIVLTVAGLLLLVFNLITR